MADLNPMQQQLDAPVVVPVGNLQTLASRLGIQPKGTYTQSNKTTFYGITGYTIDGLPVILKQVNANVLATRAANQIANFNLAANSIRQLIPIQARAIVGAALQGKVGQS